MVGSKTKNCYAQSRLYKQEEARFIKVKLEFSASITEILRSNHCQSRSNCYKKESNAVVFAYLKSCNNSKNTIKTVMYFLISTYFPSIYASLGPTVSFAAGGEREVVQ